MTVEAYLQSQKERIDRRLAQLIRTEIPQFSGLYEAMNYSLNAGGKRIRPILFLSVLEALGKDPAGYLDLACALECVHSYSLIHDDLPAMDDDDYRRGKPTNHRVYGEGTAILAGDGLLTYAFELMAAQRQPEPAKLLEAIRVFARAAGPAGMVGGQFFDLASTDAPRIGLDELKLMHRSKTGIIFAAVVDMAAILAGAAAGVRAALAAYADNLGLAFQITDDILDVTGDESVLGKPVGSDEKNHKTTYVTLLSPAGAKKEAAAAAEKALLALAGFGENARILRDLVGYLEKRAQ